MDTRGVTQAKSRLARAGKAIADMKSAVTLDDTEDAWTDFLVAMSTIYSKLEQSAKGNAKSEEWFARKKGERRNDPLLKYLHAARNSNEHGIERVVESTGPNQDLYGNKLNVNERLPVNFEELDPTTLLPAGLSGTGVLAGPTLRPIRAHDRRFNAFCDPPTMHLGKEIEFANFADALAEAAMPYLRLLVADAEALVP